jgi:predicted GNAT family acetyltransferase
MPDRADTPPVPGIDRASVRHDEAGGFYEVLVDGASAGLLVYGLEGGRRVITHVFINEEYRGHSLSTLLVRAALDDIRAAGGTVTNYCPVVGRFVDHHSEYQATIDSAHPGRWRRSKRDLADAPVEVT